MMEKRLIIFFWRRREIQSERGSGRNRETASQGGGSGEGGGRTGSIGDKDIDGARRVFPVKAELGAAGQRSTS